MDGETKTEEYISGDRDAIIFLIDTRDKMHLPLYENKEKTPFILCLEFVLSLYKSKMIAEDKSYLGISLLGAKESKNNNNIEGIYDLIEFSLPRIEKIRLLQSYINGSMDVKEEIGSLSNETTIPLSNGLWNASLAFSKIRWKDTDTQRLWYMTNDDNPHIETNDESKKIAKYLKDHLELHRSVNLFYIPFSQKNEAPSFNLSLFYSKFFTSYDASVKKETKEEEDELKCPAFPIASMEDFMVTALRKRFKKRRLALLPLRLNKTIRIGVELYSMVQIQRKPPPVFLDEENNIAKSETKWLCEDTGSYITRDQMRHYIEIGGKRVYFSSDDILQIKSFDIPSLQLLGFLDQADLDVSANIRAPYFLFPSEKFIEGSIKACLAFQIAMIKKKKVAIARLIMRTNDQPRLVALVSQEEVYDDLGQVQPSGFQVVFLPYQEDIRDVKLPPTPKASEEEIAVAAELISTLRLSELPLLENPDLQKHYASIQALALEQPELEYNEEDDMTVPVKEGFTRAKVVEKIEKFQEVIGDLQENVQAPKRKPATAFKKEKAPPKPRGVRRAKLVADDGQEIKETKPKRGTRKNAKKIKEEPDAYFVT